MAQHELIVRCFYNGAEHESDRRTFDTADEARQYYQAEHSHNDSVTSHTVTAMGDEDE